MASTEADVFDRLGRGLSALGAWIDDRFPMTKLIKEHATEYYASKNFNFWYGFGVLATFVLVLQLVTGIFLTMNYKPASADAFASVEYIMRDVDWGWLIRYLHSTGASAFFIVVYLHMFRGLLYGSYKKPRELVWIIGMFIYLSLMAEAFFGYLLPWGNMSYWGAQVIVSLFGAVPVIGNDLAEWIRGDFYISDITLNRFFAFHVIAVPLMLVLLVVVHIMALHEVGSNNPDGIEIKEHKGPDGKPIDGVAFHPYHTSKDLVIIIIFLILFSAVVFFAPDMGGYFLEHANFEPADPLRTPEHIAPVWYFTPFYAILRAVPNKLLGVALMGSAVMLLFFLPWLDRCRVKSIRYRSWVYKMALMVFAITFVALGYLGLQPPSGAVRDAVAGLHDPVLRVLLVHAVLYAHRENQAGADEGDVVRNAVIAFVLGLGLAGAAAAQHEAELDAANNNIANTASLQRGAKYFVNYCLGCHSAKYVRYNRLAQDLQLSEQQLIDNLMFTGEQAFDTMAIAMRPEDCEALVQHRAARSVADRAQPRHGLHLHVLARLLRRAGSPDGRRQRRAAGHRDAARAVAAARYAARRVRAPTSTRRGGVRALRAGSARRARRRRVTTTSCATSSTSSTTSANPSSESASSSAYA